MSQTRMKNLSLAKQPTHFANNAVHRTLRVNPRSAADLHARELGETGMTPTPPRIQ
jgi:hypothetical protein